MSGSLTRRSALQLTGVVGLTGIFGALGAQPAHALTDPGPGSTKLQKMQYRADELNVSNVGYDQSQRWTFLNKTTRTILTGKECDCSSSCGAIAWLAGYKIDLDGLITGNFAARFKVAGFSVIDFTSLSQVKTGDFLVTPGHHVVFVRDSKRWWSAEADENGNASGGKAGDQTGSECRYRAPYNRSGGWTSIVRA
ncbi:MAG: twin-arginine translocation signal domain-containing protein [Propionibacteriaceae bacterium]